MNIYTYGNKMVHAKKFEPLEEKHKTLYTGKKTSNFHNMQNVASKYKEELMSIDKYDLHIKVFYWFYDWLQCTFNLGNNEPDKLEFTDAHLSDW